MTEVWRFSAPLKCCCGATDPYPLQCDRQIDISFSSTSQTQFLSLSPVPIQVDSVGLDRGVQAQEAAGAPTHGQATAEKQYSSTAHRSDCT
jgi:hypothetical protein